MPAPPAPPDELRGRWDDDEGDVDIDPPRASPPACPSAAAAEEPRGEDVDKSAPFMIPPNFGFRGQRRMGARGRHMA